MKKQNKEYLVSLYEVLMASMYDYNFPVEIAQEYLRNTPFDNKKIGIKDQLMNAINEEFLKLEKLKKEEMSVIENACKAYFAEMDSLKAMHNKDLPRLEREKAKMLYVKNKALKKVLLSYVKGKNFKKIYEEFSKEYKEFTKKIINILELINKKDNKRLNEAIIEKNKQAQILYDKYNVLEIDKKDLLSLIEIDLLKRKQQSNS